MPRFPPIHYQKELEAHCQRVLDTYPTQWGAYRAGRCGLKFLVGRVMNLTHGLARPEDVEDVFQKRLEESSCPALENDEPA